MTTIFGSGGELRKKVLPAWVSSGPNHQATPHPSGIIEPIPFVVQQLEDQAPLVVEVDPTLELRSVQQVKDLRRRLQSVRSASPRLWPDFSDEGTPSVPNELPEGWTIEDVLGGQIEIDSGGALEVQEQWEHRLAFYRSPRRADAVAHDWTSTDYVSDWGVYLHASGVESLAREVYLPAGFDHAQALGYAAADLINHELQHAAFDMVTLRVEALGGSALGVGHHKCSPCTTEEALCTGSSVRANRARAKACSVSGMSQKLALASRLFESWASNGPAGYRDWATVYEGSAWAGAVTEVIAHDGVPDILGLGLYQGLDKVWTMDVPLWLIKDPGTALHAGLWRFGW